MTAGRLKPDGQLVPAPALAARLAAAGILTVADALARATCVRDLPDRSNHVLELEAARLFVKRTKPRGLLRRAPNPPPEAAALARLTAAGVPCARLAFAGVDRRLGAVTATFDLAPARPLDDVLRERRLSIPATAALLRAVVDVVARLHDAGLALRDLYANQIFVRPESGEVALMDAERLVAHPGGLNRRVEKDLAGLAASLPPALVPSPLRGRMIARYIHTRNLPMQATLRRFEARLKPWSERIRARAPRTPVGARARPLP